MTEDCSQSRDFKAVLFFFSQIMAFPLIFFFFKIAFYLKFPISAKRPRVVLVLMEKFQRKSVNNEKSQFT